MICKTASLPVGPQAKTGDGAKAKTGKRTTNPNRKSHVGSKGDRDGQSSRRLD
jgi:hypothetical protein